MQFLHWTKDPMVSLQHRYEMITIQMTPKEVYSMMNGNAIDDARNELHRIDAQIQALVRRKEEVKDEILRRSMVGQRVREYV